MHSLCLTESDEDHRNRSIFPRPPTPEPTEIEMLNRSTKTQRRAALISGGFDATQAESWQNQLDGALEALGAHAELSSLAASQRKHAEVDAARVNAARVDAVEVDEAEVDRLAAAQKPLFEQGWAWVQRLPRRTTRSSAEQDAARTLIHDMGLVCTHFTRRCGATMYVRLCRESSRPLRVDALVHRAAERWPGVLPSREAVAREAQQMQMEKDGLEIQQGVFLSELMAQPTLGRHLVLSMLHPTAEAEAQLETFMQKGQLDLGAARVEVHGETGYLYHSYDRYLNAEDDDTNLPLEIGTDLILLHPKIKMGVLRGDVVTHPKYRGRRIFNSGLNLTRLYHGQLSYLFYLVRDLGFVNKFYRGLAGPEWERVARENAPEDTHEKPWTAVVDTHAIGGGCQLLLVMDYVIAEAGGFFNLPARKEGIIPGCANLRLPRFMGERMARQGIMFDRTFYVNDPQSAALINEVHPRESIDEALARSVHNATMSGQVSAGGNRKAIRVQTEPLDVFRRYMATYCVEQALCHLSDQLAHNLEKHWQARSRQLKSA